MKYKVTTAYLICGGDISHKDEWVFDTREEAQQFVDAFHKAFPKFDMDDPYISPSTPEIEEIEDLRADPYTWLWQKITEKEEREKRIKERQRRQ